MSRLRCFLAVELSDAVRDRVLRLQTDVRRTVTGVKWVEEDNLHLTLLFLGEVEDREIPQVCKVAARAMSSFEPFTMSVEGFGCFPHARRPRVLWVGIKEGKDQLIRMYEALAAPLSDLGYRREDRPYSPHITLGRTKSEGPLTTLTHALETFASWEGGDSPVHEVIIMSSELTREGPLYTVLGRAPLGPS